MLAVVSEKIANTLTAPKIANPIFVDALRKLEDVVVPPTGNPGRQLQDLVAVCSQDPVKTEMLRAAAAFSKEAATQLDQVRPMLARQELRYVFDLTPRSVTIGRMPFVIRLFAQLAPQRTSHCFVSSLMPVRTRVNWAALHCLIPSMIVQRLETLEVARHLGFQQRVPNLQDPHLSQRVHGLRSSIRVYLK